MSLPTTVIGRSIFILLLAALVARGAIVQREQTKCTWPDTDTLFIVDSTLGISSYDHVLEIKFLEQILSLMRISSNQSRVALAQFTPQSKHEYSLASEGRESAFAAVQRLQHIGCDSSVDRNGCQPTASVNSIASFSLREGNRKAVPDVIVVISSSKWMIPELRPKETLMSPISPIHSFYILVGASSAPQKRFEPAATSIMLTALDFSSLTQIVEPLCRSVNDFVFYGTPGNVPPPFTNNTGGWTKYPLYPVNVQTPKPDLHVPWDHFSPLAWTITALLILVFFIILLALGLAVWQYRDENNRLKRKLSEQEGRMRQQNEYFTGKLHKQMEAEIAARDKFEEELRKTEEKHIHHAERLERRLEKHLDAPREAPAPPPQPPPPPQPIIIPAFFGGANNNEKPKRSSSLETAELEEGRRHRSGRRRSSLDMGSASTDQSRVGGGKKTGRRKKKKDDEHLDKSMIVLPSGRRIRGNLNELITVRELHDLEEELETSRRLGRMTDRLKLKNELSRLDLALSQTETAWKSYLANRRRSSDDSGVSVERLEGGRVVHYQGSLPFDHPARILPPIDLLFLVDSSSSIGLVAFEQIKQNIDILLKDVDIAPGRSRVAMIQFARQPSVVFGFDKYFSAEAVKRAINRMPYTGGATYLAKALSFAAGILWHEQNLKEEKLEALENAPIPRHDRLQILMVVSDGSSEDNVDRATAQLHEQLQGKLKVAGLVTRNLAKEKLTAVTRFDGAVFVMDQTESINIWLWRQQRLWMDNYEQYLEREKTIITAREERKKRGQKSPKKSPKKQIGNGNSANQMSKLKLNSSLRTARSIKPLSFL